MRKNPHAVTADFEAALCEYTGAPFAVAVNSCTMALLLATAYALKHRELPVVRPGGVAEMRFDPQADQHMPVARVPADNEVSIPKFTYPGVPMSIVHAGGKPTFRDEDWAGWYQLKPLKVFDCARWFTQDVYNIVANQEEDRRPGRMVCVSFHVSKTMGLEQGGAILHDDPEADAWLRRARFDGRTSGVNPADDPFPHLGWHCYINPSAAALGILKLYSMPRQNAPLPKDPYPDLSLLEIFK